MTFKAHFDGNVIVAEPTPEWVPGQEVVVSVPEATSVSGSGKTVADLLEWLREEHDPSVWADIGDSAEFARSLGDESNRSRYTL